MCRRVRKEQSVEVRENISKVNRKECWKCAKHNKKVLDAEQGSTGMSTCPHKKCSQDTSTYLHQHRASGDSLAAQRDIQLNRGQLIRAHSIRARQHARRRDADRQHTASAHARRAWHKQADIDVGECHIHDSSAQVVLARHCERVLQRGCEDKEG